MTYRERRERRAEQREEWAAKRRSKQAADFDSAQQLADQIPLGQPILVGHHSEKRARRDAERIQNGMTRGVEHGKMADHHASAAETIRAQLDRSIYRDDIDAVDRLEEKIADLEARRDRMKAVNAWFTKHSGFPRRRVGHQASEADWAKAKDAIKRCREAMSLTTAECLDMATTIEMNAVIGFPGYALSGVGATIRKEKKRRDALLADVKIESVEKAKDWSLGRLRPVTDRIEREKA